MWRKLLCTVVLCVTLLLNITGCGAQSLPDQPVAVVDPDLPTVAPEDVGWSSDKLAELAAYAESVNYTAIVLACDGKVFFSWGEVEKNYQCHSIRKPFLSALYGFYVDDGTIGLDQTMADLGIDDIPPSLTAEEKQANVRHLLQGRSGVYHAAAAEIPSMTANRPERGSHAPGTFFYYNNWDFNAAGTIFRQETGRDIFKDFKVRIADAIGMQDFDPDLCAYNYEPEFSKHPSYRFRMSARDMVRFGILFQKGGVWNGKRVISGDWFEESTTSYSSHNSALGAGFGYMWGVTLEEGRLKDVLGGTGLFFSGIGVHHLVIVDDIKLVFVLRYDTDGNWSTPPAESTGKLYGLLKAARVGGGD
jgi:CubicO group peptidase (beta-lactamase class C family)